MPFNGSGTYSPPSLPVFPPTPGAVISSSYYTQVVNDIAAGLSLTFLRDGSVPLGGDLNVNGNVVKGLASGTAGAPSLRFNSETNSGFYLNGAGHVAISVQGNRIVDVGTAGALMLGTTFFGDVNYYKGLSGVQTVEQFDTNDYVAYNRTTNTRAWVVNNVSEMILTPTALTLPDNDLILQAGGVKLQNVNTAEKHVEFVQPSRTSYLYGSATQTGFADTVGGVFWNYTFADGVFRQMATAFNGPASAPQLLVADTQYYLNKDGSGFPVANYDAGDYMYYNRTLNKFFWVVANTAVMSLDSGGTLRLAGTVLQSTAP